MILIVPSLPCPCLGGVFHTGIGFVLSKQLLQLAMLALGWFCHCGAAHVDGHKRLATEEVKFAHPLHLEGVPDTGHPMPNPSYNLFETSSRSERGISCENDKQGAVGNKFDATSLKEDPEE